MSSKSYYQPLVDWSVNTSPKNTFLLVEIQLSSLKFSSLWTAYGGFVKSRERVNCVRMSRYFPAYLLESIEWSYCGKAEKKPEVEAVCMMFNQTMELGCQELLWREKICMDSISSWSKSREENPLKASTEALHSASKPYCIVFEGCKGIWKNYIMLILF